MQTPPTQTAETETGPPRDARIVRRRRAQLILLAFLATFLCARVLVFLIMARMLPDLFLHVRGTHVHHLNYGIFLLVAVGAWLLLRPPRNFRWPAILYGVGLGLTFDEFGMWLHLGGSYWQRASWDAVVVVAAVLALFGFGPALAQYRSRHWCVAAAVFLVTVLFFWMLVKSLDHTGQRVLPRLQRVEETSPP
jgi:ABC-type nickel/cobalt efflux system permease component RcnA